MQNQKEEKNNNLKKTRVAIVHDFLVQRGGAERVLENICELFPNAPIYTLLYDEKKMRGMFKGKDIRVSYLQKFPRFLKKRYQWLLPFLMVIPETFDLREFDLIISSSGAWSKGIVTKLEAKHIAYLHSPMRFVWDYNERYLKERGMKNSFFKRIVFSYLRIWDKLASDRPDFLIANSKYTQKRIEKYYRRESEVIYPSVGVNLKDNEPRINSKFQDCLPVGKVPGSKFFLVVSRLSGYKRVDIIVEAFNKLDLPLVIIGEGDQGNYLRKIANRNITIVNWKSDEDLADYYRNARAFVFAAEEDFGIAPVEAMEFGLPVIAYRKGGVLETVVEGVSGEFFDAQTPEVLADGIRRFIENEENYDRQEIRKMAEKFSKERFKREFSSYIERMLS